MVFPEVNVCAIACIDLRDSSVISPFFLAGGYDAIWVLVLDPPQSAVTKDDERPLHHVENVWASWTKLDVSPLSASESFDKGFRLEKIDDVPGLRGILS